MIYKKQKKYISAFSLIEILIATLLVSIGLLAVARLQLVSLKQTHAAYLRTVADAQLFKMAECLRLNMLKHTCQQEKAEWEKQVAIQLPGGMGKIYKKSNAFQVIVAWNDQWIGNLGKTCPNGIPTQLTCVVMDVSI